MIFFERIFQLYNSVVLLLIVFLAEVHGACDSPWTDLDDSCYYVSPNDDSQQMASWHQSQAWCLQNGGNLATIEDIEERRLITNLTQLGSYNGEMWIGLNKQEDRVNYKWVDGTSSEFRDWAESEPNDESLGMCAFQLTHPPQGCFTHDPGINTIDGLFAHPHDENRPHTFYFGYLAWVDDNEGSAECQSRCSVEPPCYSYTFISNSIPSNATWMGECMGRSNEYNISEPGQYVFSGVRYNCDETGLWYVGNCGERKGGFICKKAANDTSTPNPTTLSTPAVPGFCPAGFFDAGGNKCFKIVVKTDIDGVNWDTAVELCRAGSGIAPDLASILSEYESAAITMQLRNEYFPFWIGLRISDTLQWLWTDNQDVSYGNWASEKPSGPTGCAELWTNPGPAGTWNNLDCSYKRGYICQVYKDANSIIVTPPVTPVHLCKADYYNYGGICYRKITSVSNWSAALATCEAEGATLATIHSEAENAALYVFAYDVAPFWIGYYKDGSNEWVWTDGWPDIYSNWNAGEEPGTGGGCASFKDTGKWKDDQCTSNLAAICMISTATVPTSPIPVEGDCPFGWLDYGSSCYYFSQYSDTFYWETAVEECSRRAGPYTTGSLVSIHNAVENNFIYEQLKILSITSAWIGLYKENQGLSYKWSDGSERQYDRWAPGEPNGLNGTQLCTEIYVTLWPGMWNDQLCDNFRPYVCKAPKVNRTTTPPGPSCPSECGWATYGAQCYHADFSRTLTFDEAQEACVLLAGEYASLVTIPDYYTNSFVMKMVQEQSQVWAPIWIGLNRSNADEPFHWIDDSELSFTNWATGEPTNEGDELCADMHNRDGEWSDINCETIRLSYICQIKREHVPQPMKLSQEADSSNSETCLTSGELAGVILGTMFGTIVMMVGIGLTMYLVVRGRPVSAATKQLDEKKAADAYDVPYESFDGLPTRSSSVRTSSRENNQFEYDA